MPIGSAPVHAVTTKSIPHCWFLPSPPHSMGHRQPGQKGNKPGQVWCSSFCRRYASAAFKTSHWPHPTVRFLQNIQYTLIYSILVSTLHIKVTFTYAPFQLKSRGVIRNTPHPFCFRWAFGAHDPQRPFAMVLMLIWNGREPFIFTENGPAVVHESTLHIR